MFLIVGLGNYEKKYFKTYHNIGFMVVDKLCEKLGYKFSKSECMANTCEFFINHDKILVAKPNTYMNFSGHSLASFKNKYKLNNSEILVIADDIDLPLGSFRFREKGSGGTHNGLKHIVQTIGNDFARIRIGVGRPHENQDLADFVLSNITHEKMEILNNVIDEVVDFILKKIEERNNTNKQEDIF